jgi:hypothetical protein
MSSFVKIVLISSVFVLIATSTLAKIFGENLILDETTSISEILNNGDAYIGKRVKVEGLIVDVCAKRGCWMYIAGQNSFEKLRFKVIDGEIVIPMEARGKRAVAEGEVQKFDLSREQVIEMRKHHAEGTGQPFNPASVTSGETFFQLRGLSVEIPEL